MSRSRMPVPWAIRTSLSRIPVRARTSIGVTPWLALAGFVWLIAHNVIPVEEAMLDERFGQEYHEYRATVRRWI